MNGVSTVICVLAFWVFAVADENEYHSNVNNADDWILPSVEGLASLDKKKKTSSVFLDGISSFATDSRSPNIEAFGYADYYNHLSMSKDSRFPIASNTKLFTAVAIYQLQEQGMLDLDADLSTMLNATDFASMGLSPRWHKRFCPRLKYSLRCEVMTLRNLLSMSSGIYPALNCDTDVNPNSCNRVPYVLNQEGSIAHTVGTFITQPLIFKPGTQYHYSNPNFILAAYFVEKYSGLNFRDYLRIHIFDRIGLNQTYYDYFNGAFQMDPHRVRQFFKYYDAETQEFLSVGTDTVQLDLGVASGTGGVLSTAANHIHFWYSLFNQTSSGAPLLSDSASQKSILAPWTLMRQGKLLWKNQTYDTWSYYTQGVAVVCLQEGCHPNPPRWIFYMGGTVTVRTANVMDLHFGAMAQVWTSTLVTMPKTKKEFQNVVDSQTGISLEFIAEWAQNAAAQMPDPITMCFLKLLDRYPPIATAHFDSESADHDERSTE